jgi:NAD(P)-dependent dehydrogenase (short-subunit alcohol dehydrogenase family)
MTLSSDAGGHEWARQWYQGRSVVVTGGTSGIGAGIARAFAAAGASVTATGVSLAETEAARVDGMPEAVELVVLDVRDRSAVEALFAPRESLDVLVNCAGIIRRGEELDPDVFDQVVDINLGGTMRCCAAARRALAAVDGGVIINTASMLSFFGGGLVPGYAASKGGIAQLTRSLAIAYGADGIRVNAVAPGWIATTLTGALRADPERSDAILSRSIIKRWGTPDDVAQAVLFLASPAARFITGTIMPVDGGYSAS